MLKEDNQKIISFSLFGNKDIYLIGALENAALVDSIYPGWVARFYVDDTVSNRTDMARFSVRTGDSLWQPTRRWSDFL